MFDYLPKHPTRQSRYSKGMTRFSSRPELAAVHIANGFDWASLKCLGASDAPDSTASEDRKPTVLDVGGSYGTSAIAIAKEFPQLKLIVQDRPEVVESGEKALQENCEVPHDVKERITFMKHNFFDSQPVKGAEVYLFRFIMHDWSDKYCVKILQALIPALEKGSRVIIADTILPESGAGAENTPLLKLRSGRYVHVRPESRSPSFVVSLSPSHFFIFRNGSDEQ